MCAADEPGEIEYFSFDGLVKCSTKCIVSGKCYAYNFREEEGRCDTYRSIPQNYSAIDGCVSSVAKGKYDVGI